LLLGLKPKEDNKQSIKLISSTPTPRACHFIQKGQVQGVGQGQGT
jgi:hypothetical protein